MQKRKQPDLSALNNVVIPSRATTAPIRHRTAGMMDTNESSSQEKAKPERVGIFQRILCRKTA